MHNVTVDGWEWASHDKDEYSPDTTSIDFNVYKKGILGRLKKIRGDYALMFTVDENNVVDIDSIAIHEFSAGIIPFNPHLAYGVIKAAIISMEQAGDDEKAKILRGTSKIFFKKKILKK